MKYSYVAAALAAPVALAAPAKRQSTNIDATVLQFALTLEHLENVFYHQALAKFSAADFMAAGYGANYYNNLKYISFDEQQHVSLLTSALTAAGAKPVAACTYNFPYTDVNSFITLSSVLEGVGVSAYLGGAPLITSKDYLTVAASILVTESLHTSLQRNAINEVIVGTPYGTPLDPTSVYTLAAMFITGCPSSNMALPFTPYPTLTLTTMAGTCEAPNCYPPAMGKRDMWATYTTAGTAVKTIADGQPQAPTATAVRTIADGQPQAATATATAVKTIADGQPQASGTGSAKAGATSAAAAAKNMKALAVGATVSFTVKSAAPAGSFLTFVYGLTVTSVPISGSGMTISAAIPATAGGQTYVFLTKTAAAMNKLDGSSILAGPAIVEVAPAPAVIDNSS